MSNVDQWKSIIDKITKSAEIKGRVKALTEVGELVNKRQAEAKDNPEISLDSVVNEVMALIAESGLTGIMEKINLDREVDTELRAMIASGPSDY